MIDWLLTQQQLSRADLQGIIYIRGPGAFTGVRIGVSVVQGISMALSLPTIGVSSLLALAWQAVEAELSAHPIVLCAMDARMQQVYWAVYQFDAQGRWQVLDDEAVGMPLVMPHCTHWVGDGIVCMPCMADALQQQPTPEPSASFTDLSALYRLVQRGLSLGLFEWQTQLPLPVYLRQDVACVSTKSK